MLTLSLVDPAAVAAPSGPIAIPADTLSALARALNTVFYGFADDSVDGAPCPCEDFWLVDIPPETLDLAVFNLTAEGRPIDPAFETSARSLIAHAQAEQRLIDVVRDAPGGPELRLSDEDAIVDPRLWTLSRLTRALGLMGLQDQEAIHAVDLIAAARRVVGAGLQGRPARDAERLGTFGEHLQAWNDIPMLAYGARRSGPSEAADRSGMPESVR